MEEEKKKKGIKLFPLVLIACILFVLMILSYVYLMASDVVDLPEEVSTNSVENEIEVLEENDVEIQSDYSLEESFLESLDGPESDFGNKEDPSKKYVYVKEHRFEDYGYDDPFEAHMVVLPYINIKSEEIDKLNKELEDTYNSIASKYDDEDTIKNEEPLPEFTYYYQTANGILSLTTVYATLDDEAIIHYFNIDISKGKILSNKELLEKVGIDKEKFEKLVDDALLEQYFQWRSEDDEFSQIYSTFDSYLNNVTFSKSTGYANAKFVNDYDKICELCEMSYDYVEGENGTIYDSIIITRIESPVPRYYANDGLVDDSIIIEDYPHYVYSVSYSYTVNENYDTYGTGNSFYAHNRMPYINLDSVDARYINKTLEEYFNKAKKSIQDNGGEIILRAVETDEEIELPDGHKVKATDEIIVNKEGKQVIEEYYTIDYWYSVVDDKILTLVVELTNDKYSNLSHGFWEFEVYHFDLETGKMLSNKEYIEKCGYTEEEFLSKVKNVIDIESIQISPFTYQQMSSGEAYEKQNVKSINEFYVVPKDFLDTWLKVQL